MTARLAVLIMLLSSFVAERPAAAATADEALAAKSFREGEVAFARREFAPAALAFERAARLVPHPSPWLNAAEAWEKAGDFLRAAEDCDRALALPSDEPAFAAEAKERLARLERMLARLEIEGDSNFRVRMDDGSVSTAPFTRRLEAGRHRVVWTWSGGPTPIDRELWVELARGESKSIALPELLGPSATEPPSDTPPASGSPSLLEQVPTASWIAFGVSATAVVAGATFGGLTLAAQKDFDADPTRARADTFFARRRVTNIAFVTAGVAAAAGAVLWFIDDGRRGDSGASAPRAGAGSISFAVGPDGALVMAGVRY